MKLNRILLAVALFVLPITLAAQPFVGWRGAARDGIYKETGLLKAWPTNGPELLWESMEAGKGFSSPVIYQGKIYITGLNESGEKETLSAFTTEGKKLYTVEFGTPWKASYSDSRSTPTIVGDKAYVVSGVGEVVCLNTTDGKVVWTVDAKSKFEGVCGIWGTSESPLVVDNMVIYSPAGAKTIMVALNAQTGATIWQTKAIPSQISSYVSPQFITHKGKRQIVGITLDKVIGVNPQNGDIEWQFSDWASSKTGEPQGKISTNTPIYKDGRLYISNGYDMGSFMLELNDTATDVKLVWRNDDLDTHIGGVVLVNGTIYGANWINNNQGDWVAVDWATGATKYITPWAGGKGKGSIISADNMLYIYDERRGMVGLVNPTPEKFDVVSEFRIAKGEGPHWAHPVISNGVLYVRHGSALMAFKVK